MLLPIIAEEVKDLMKSKRDEKSDADDVRFAKVALGALSVLKSKLVLAEKKKGSELTIEEEYKIVKKEFDETWDSYLQATEGGREDAANEEHEKHMVIGTFVNILESKMPKRLNENEVRGIVEGYAAALGRSDYSMKDKGLFMKTLNAELKGQVDGKILNEVVTEFLSK